MQEGDFKFRRAPTTTNKLHAAERAEGVQKSSMGGDRRREGKGEGKKENQLI